MARTMCAEKVLDLGRVRASVQFWRAGGGRLAGDCEPYQSGLAGTLALPKRRFGEQLVSGPV